MDELIKAAQVIMIRRKPKKYTKLQVLTWMVKRFQYCPRRAASK